jgi:hypothetical protein
MVGGMATIAGGVLLLHCLLGGDSDVEKIILQNIYFTASIMSAPRLSLQKISSRNGQGKYQSRA